MNRTGNQGFCQQQSLAPTERANVVKKGLPAHARNAVASKKKWVRKMDHRFSTCCNLEEVDEPNR